MKALAAFTMRGRASAVLVMAVAAVLFWLFPPFMVVSAAALALVTLRRGAAESLLLLVLAGSAATGLAALVLGTPWPMLDVLLAGWLPLWLLALMLRATVSLARTLQVAAALGLVGVLLCYLVLGDPAAWWNSLLEPLRQEAARLGPTLPAAERDTLDRMLALLGEWAPFLPGHLASMILLNGLLALFLGRGWQAALFNPGGFRTEFHALRLGRPLAGLTLVLLAGALLSGWVPLTNLALPLSVLYTVQGIALVHALAFARSLSPAWLLLFYLLLLPLLSQLVLALGLADAWIDLRARLRPKAQR
ncbi:MAG: hypothetical protein EKK69_00290 [Candidatus Competibacteraceae bacterium]|nr:MAG: hypothetical protein EKK69_00290 [Candidatus Competibacteraceae bacterium]